LKFYNLVTRSMQRFNATWPSTLNMLTRCDATLMIRIENRQQQQQQQHMYGHNHHQHQQQGAILDKSNGQKVPGTSSEVGALEERWNQHHRRWRLLVKPGGESVAHVERLLLTSLIACLLACLLIAVQNSRNLHERQQLPDKGGRCAA
jgi:hypothetical protein